MVIRNGYPINGDPSCSASRSAIMALRAAVVAGTGRQGEGRFTRNRTPRHAQLADQARRAALDRAAQLTGKTRTDFVLEAARRAAEDALLDRVLIAVEPDAYAAFLRRLDEPPKPNVRLRRTMLTSAPWDLAHAGGARAAPSAPPGPDWHGNCVAWDGPDTMLGSGGSCPCSTLGG